MTHNANETYSVDEDGKVFAGHDMPAREFYATPEPEDDTATAEEKIALADAMIARWVAYKEKVSQ